jgi:sulfate permease, SulP family
LKGTDGTDQGTGLVRGRGTPAAPEGVKPPILAVGDLWGGLAAMLVALPSSIAFGIATFTVMGLEHKAEGALAGMLGAAALGLVAALVGRSKGLISAPCAPAAAVLSASIADLAAGKFGAPLTPDRILPLVALTALLAALLQVLYGALKWGRLIKFIPYPVVSGYLSGVGVIIALGQLPKLLGLPKETSLGKGLISPGLWRWESLVVGLVTMVVVFLAPRFIQRVPAAILGLLGGLGTYFALGLVDPSLLTLTGNPLVIGAVELPPSFLDAVAARATSLVHFDLASLSLVIYPALTLSVLLSIDTLKTTVGLDSVMKHRTDADRTLIGQGVGNLAAVFTGGMPGSGAMGPSMVNVTSGAVSFKAGVIEGLLVLLVLLFLTPLISWIPVGALAGILLVIAWRMFDKQAFHLLKHPSGRFDFLVTAAVVAVAVADDLITAAGVGVGLAILLFIRDLVRRTVLRRKLYLTHFRSKTHRLPEERAVLDRDGDQGVFCELQGNLFFGTTDQLFTILADDLKLRKYVLLDMRRVQSMDYTAAHLFEQMNNQLEERGGRLLFCGMPSGLMIEKNFVRYLKELGVAGGRRGVLIMDTMDGAIEWIENRILHDAGVRHSDGNPPLEVGEFAIFRGFDGDAMARLESCAETRSYRRGDKIFDQGDQDDDLFLVRRGSVRILMHLEGGLNHHLATIGRGDFFGELAFLDRRTRSAEAEAKEPTELYVLSRAKLEARFADRQNLGVRFFSRLALVIAERLRQADADLRVLEER